jgi:hypothetical protein
MTWPVDLLCSFIIDHIESNTANRSSVAVYAVIAAETYLPSLSLVMMSLFLQYSGCQAS